jgi:hypothetical protein
VAVGAAVNGLGRFLRAEWDRVAGYGCIAVGLALLVAGIAGVRSSADVIDEISYLVTGGIGSIFLLGVGSTLLLSADLHDDFRKLHRVEQKLDRVERLLLAEHPELAPSLDLPAPAAVPLPAAHAALAVRRGRAFAGVGIALAAVLFVAGVARTTNEATTDHLAGPVGLALAGALLVSLVAAVMVAQLRAAVEGRKTAIFGAWLAADATGRVGPAFTAVDASPAHPVAAGESLVFVATGQPLYHRAGCQLLADRSVTECDKAGLAPGISACRLCEPG